MDNEAMTNRAKQLVVDYFNAHVDVTDGKRLTIEDVFIVWFSKTLQNWKALVSTTVSDGMYYEITHNVAIRARPIWTPTRSGTTSASRTKGDKSKWTVSLPR